MTNTELLPCFGCKSTNIEYNHIHKVRWGVHCIDCDLHTDPDSKTKEDAAIHWNKYKRYPDDIPERCFMQDRTDEYDDGYCNGYDAGIRADKAAPVGDAGNADCSLSVAYEDGYQKGMKDARKRSAPVWDELLDGLSDAVNEQCNEGAGYWSSCSGCHQTDEGVSLGRYSKILQTNLGIGCRECGGLGAVWSEMRHQSSQPKQSAPVERIEGLAEAITLENDCLYMSPDEAKAHAIVLNAARAYLKASGV